MTTKYAKLDGLIIERMKMRHKATLTSFMQGLCGGEAGRIAEVENTGVEPFRVLDRRLQALRKKGLISYSTTYGWQLTEKGKLWKA